MGAYYAQNVFMRWLKTALRRKLGSEFYGYEEISARKDSKCKGPEMELLLTCLMYSLKASGSRIELVRRVGSGEHLEQIKPKPWS